MKTLGVVILLKEQENLLNLEAALKSVGWSQTKLLIVDGHKPLPMLLTLAKRWKAKLVVHRMKDFASQRNWAEKQLKTDWVLHLDADEVVTSSLAREIRQNIQKPGHIAFSIQRQDRFLGKTLQFGETGNIRFVRLGRKGAGKWVRPVHEVWQFPEENGKLSTALLHSPHVSIHSFLQKVNDYSTREAAYRKQQGVKHAWHEIVIFPLAKFFYNYIILLGILDGFEGLVYAVMMSLHSFLVRAKMYEKR